MIQLTIDGKSVQTPEGRSLLEACRENNIHIPTLCYHPALQPYGACRLCMVEIQQGNRPSRLVASCTYPCEDGLQVQTSSPAVLKSRRITAELLLAGAWNSPEIKALAEQLGVQEVRYHLPQEELCVVCGLCIRACKEIVGVEAISFIHRGIDKAVSPPFRLVTSACIGCGTCVLICPTSVLHLEKLGGAGSAIHVHPLSDPYADHHCRICSDSGPRLPALQELEALLAPARR